MQFSSPDYSYNLTVNVNKETGGEKAGELTVQLICYKPPVLHDILIGGSKGFNYAGGKSYSFFAAGPVPIDNVDSITVSWKNHKSLAKKMLPGAKIVIDSISFDPLYAMGAAEGISLRTKKFCGNIGATKIESGKSQDMKKKC